MSQIISLTVHGRTYQIATDEGKESHLQKLAEHIDRRMAEQEARVGQVGEQRLEAACRRALAIGSPTRKRIIAILKAKLDQHPDLFPAADTAAATASRTHSNVRGADYFRVPSTTDVENTTTDEGDDDACSSNPRSIH